VDNENMSDTINADPAELAKFSELAHRWWDPESEFRPLHQINPLRLEWIIGLAPLVGKKVLDVGCGGGILADSMARKGADVTGIDLPRKRCGLPSCTPSRRRRPLSSTGKSALKPWRPSSQANLMS